MCYANESGDIDRLNHLESILSEHNIPLLQPTTGLIISHVGIPKFNTLFSLIRRGNGRVVLAIRALLLALSFIPLIFAFQNSYTGNTLSGTPWTPLIDVSDSLIDVFIVLSTSYLLVPIALILGALVMLGVDFPIYWLYRDNSKRLGIWIVFSSIVWLAISLSLGLLIETTITWGLVLFPEAATQIDAILVGGALVIGWSQAALFITTSREFIRATKPDLISIEGRILALRDFLANRRFIMRWPYSDLSEVSSKELAQSIFYRETWVNVIRGLIFISFSLGVDYVLATFGLFPVVPVFDSAIITLIGPIILSITLLVIRNDLQRNRRRCSSAYQAMSLVIFSEGIFLALVCGFAFSIVGNGIGLLFLLFISWITSSLYSKNTDILHPIYHRYLLTALSPADRNMLIDDILDQLSEVLSL